MRFWSFRYINQYERKEKETIDDDQSFIALDESKQPSDHKNENAEEQSVNADENKQQNNENGNFEKEKEDQEEKDSTDSVDRSNQDKDSKQDDNDSTLDQQNSSNQNSNISEGEQIEADEKDAESSKTSECNQNNGLNIESSKEKLDNSETNDVDNKETDEKSSSEEQEDQTDESMQENDSSKMESETSQEEQELSSNNDSAEEPGKNNNQQSNINSEPLPQLSEQNSEFQDGMKMPSDGFQNEGQSSESISNNSKPSDQGCSEQKSDSSESTKPNFDGNSYVLNESQESENSEANKKDSSDNSTKSDSLNENGEESTEQCPSKATTEMKSNKEEKSSEPKNGEKEGSEKTDNTNEQNNNKNPEDLSEQEKQDLEDVLNDKSNLDREAKKELLKKAKKRVEKSKRYKAKLTPGNKKYIKSLEEERISENNSNNITDALGELPSFEERQRGDGYAIDTTKLEKVPNSVIKTLIDKFLNQRFCKKETNLNIRSNSLEETNGFHKWKVKDVIVHLKTHQVTKVLTDKVGYTYADGKNENVPLSFYFDMSGSMEAFTSLLATIAIELLKKDVKVLIGYNESVNVQVEKIDKDISIDELVEFLTQAGDYDYNCIYSLKKQKKVTYIPINRNIDNYLVEKKAERCVVFSDFDPISEVVNLSSKADVYWFCFEDSFDRYDLKYFQGFIYKVKNIKDIAQGLIKVNSKRFESLCFTDNPAALRGKVRKRQ